MADWTREEIEMLLTCIGVVKTEDFYRPDEMAELEALEEKVRALLSLAERHQRHHQTCNCLGDKAICCDPSCPCHEAALNDGHDG